MNIRINTGSGNWSNQYALQVQMSDGTTRALRLKVCLGTTFGRSELDYYGRDYLRMPDAPLVRQRWSQPHGMSLLHGDLNPTNILSPAHGGSTPLYFLDRQPFDWSLTYGLAASDLAYFMIPWWPEETRQACERPVLRQWYETLNAPEYSWSEAEADWRLSVEQCLNVPMEWCSNPATIEAMQGL